MTQDFEFTITISADGRQVEGVVKGIKGKSCAKVAAILDPLGDEVDHKTTEEWNATASATYQVGLDLEITVGSY